MSRHVFLDAESPHGYSLTPPRPPEGTLPCTEDRAGSTPAGGSLSDPSDTPCSHPGCPWRSAGPEPWTCHEHCRHEQGRDGMGHCLNCDEGLPRVTPSVLDERRLLPPDVLVSAIQTPTHPTSGRLISATPLPRWTPPDGTLPDRWRRERHAVREAVASQELAGVVVWRDGPMGGETPPDTTVE